MEHLVRCLAGAVTAAAAACLLGVVPAHAAPVAAEGSLSVLTYNVAGLPQVLSSASTDRQASTTAIGRRLAPYDLVHVQEDFNYHAALYAADSHPHRTATSGGAGIGSGLNTLSRSAHDGDDFERVRWNDCRLDSGDCLTPKGFTFMRVRLAEGVYLDAYNLHANAGTTDGDEQARAANLAQLTAHIRTHSAGNAVLVAGDTNTRYTRAADTIAAFAADNGLTDAWVALERGGVAPEPGTDPLLCDGDAVTDTCEVVDKVLYRGSRLVALTATSYANRHADFLDRAGLMLSDHDPIAVGLTWSANPAYRVSEQFGGPHGDHFNDVDRIAPGARVAAVTLRAGARVDQVGLTLADGTGSVHGGTTTSDCVTRTAPTGWQVAGFTGRSGDNVDKLGLIHTQR